MGSIHWLERELSKSFKQLDLNRGVDLDRNGEIEGSEITDQDGDGSVDSSEWQRFVHDNETALKGLGGYFKTYYSAGKAFVADNPVHDLLWIESEVSSSKDVARAYAKVESLLQDVRKRIANRKPVPEELLKAPYEAILEGGFRIIKDDSGRDFITDFNRGGLDCNTSSFVVLAIAHELNWPTHFVSAPMHAFVRWDDGAGKRMNMDWGDSFPDENYIQNLNISPRALENRIYLSNSSRDELVAGFYLMRSEYYLAHQKYEDLIRDLDTAVDLCPNLARAFVNRASALGALERYDEAFRDFERALELDPDSYNAYLNRCIHKSRLGRYDEAIVDINKAISLDLNIPTAYIVRGDILMKLELYGEAILDFERAIQLNPYDTTALGALGIAKWKAGRGEEGLREFDKAAAIAPDSARVYFARAEIEMDLKKYEEAIEDYDRVIRLDPGARLARVKRADAVRAYKASRCSCDTVGQMGGKASLLSLILALFID